MIESNALLIKLIKSTLRQDNHTFENIDMRIQSQVYEESVSHQISPLLYHSFKALVRPVEDGVLSSWHQTYFIDSMKHHYYLEHIKPILKKATKAGIPVTLFKGLYTNNLYPHKAYRSMSDYDLYVPRPYLKEFGDLLLDVGYQVDKNISEDIHIAYNHKALKTVEVHHSVVSQNLPPHYRSFDQTFADNLVPYDFDGIQVTIPSKEVHALYTCIHMMGHLVTSGFGLRGVIDIYLLACGKDFDWDYFLKLSRDHFLDRFSLSIIKLCVEYFGLEVPTAIMKAFKGISPEIYQNLIADMWYTGEFGIKSKSAKSNSAYASLMTSSKSHHQSSITDIFPKYQYMKIHYPILKKLPVLLPLMWIIRIIKVIAAFRPSRVSPKNKLLKYMIK